MTLTNLLPNRSALLVQTMVFWALLGQAPTSFSASTVPATANMAGVPTVDARHNVHRMDFWIAYDSPADRDPVAVKSEVSVGTMLAANVLVRQQPMETVVAYPLAFTQVLAQELQTGLEHQHPGDVQHVHVLLSAIDHARTPSATLMAMSQAPLDPHTNLWHASGDVHAWALGWTPADQSLIARSAMPERTPGEQDAIVRRTAAIAAQKRAEEEKENSDFLDDIMMFSASTR